MYQLDCVLNETENSMEEIKKNFKNMRQIRESFKIYKTTLTRT